MEFKQAVVTKQGRELMAKLLAGKQTTFTKVKVSSTVYQDGQLENLTALTNIKQEATAQAYGNNTATISVTATIENTGLQTGYYINTVGLYATDPDKGEILYSVSSASVNGYMPPDTGVSKSGFNFKIYSEVGNASQVNLEVDPAAVATQSDLTQLREELQLTEAWSNSPDGSIDFSKMKWNENLWIQSRMISGFINGSTGAVVSVPEYTAHQVDPYLIPCSPGVTLIKQTWNPNKINNTTNSTRVGCYDDNRQFIGYIFNDGLSSTEHKISKAITLPLTAYIRLSSVLGYAGGNLDNSIKIKFEISNSPSPFTSAPADRDDKSFLKYYGLSLTDSDTAADYVWMESPEYTRYKSKVDNEDFQIAWNSGQKITRKHLIDFKDKSKGDNEKNPHTITTGSYSNIRDPGDVLNEIIQVGYVQVNALDGVLARFSDNEKIGIPQVFVKWNLVEQINRNYPGLYEMLGLDNLDKKVAFLKANIQRLKTSIWGYGSNPNGNRLTMRVYSNWENDWGTSKPTNQTDQVKELTIVTQSSATISGMIQNDGFVYILAYAEPSDETIASTVNIDYASLEYTLSFKKSDFDIDKEQYAKDLGEIKEWIAAHS